MKTRFRFSIGEIVHHRRYKYRGVVFGVDSCFRSSEEWYLRNRLQPNKEQPWYHVLVDGAKHTTYVAEDNLKQSLSKSPIDHPLADKLFASYEEGRYFNHSVN